VFQRLHVPPGQHEITLHLQGYRTVTQKLYLTVNSTYKLRATMEKLGPGEVAEPVPSPPPPPPEAQGPPPQRTGPRQGPPMGRPPYPPQGQPPGPGQPGPATSSSFGSVVVQVQPAGAEIVIDGQHWTASEGARLVVQLSDGTHRVEIQRDGYRRYSADIQVHPGETIPLNVSLSPER
jgi:PEGA domain